MKRTIAIILGFLAMAGLILGTPGAAHAQGSGNQWYYGGAWINAWNGGPWVKVYLNSSHGGGSNDDFTLISNGGHWQLEFTGNGPSGYCIGDAYNDPNHADTSLNPCGGVIGGGPYGQGTGFIISQPCGKGSYAFENEHWTSVIREPAFLGPPDGFTNGSLFWLNNANLAYCFRFYLPA